MVSSLSEIERITSASVHFLLTFESNWEKVIQLISEKVFAKCDIVENKFSRFESEVFKTRL